MTDNTDAESGTDEKSQESVAEKTAGIWPGVKAASNAKLNDLKDWLDGIKWGDHYDDIRAGLITLGDWGVQLAKLSIALPVLVLAPVLSVLPASWRIWHKVTRWSAYQMQKASSAHAVANVRKTNGEEDLVPAAWVEGAEDEKDRTGWKVKGIDDKRYDGAVHGNASNRMGKANLIHLNEDSLEQGTWVEATIDNALQLDRESYLFRDAVLRAEQIVVSEDGMVKGLASSNGAGQAMADGGEVNLPVSLEKPGVLEDALIPTGSRGDYDGQVVSWNQYQSLKEEQSDQETVRTAKNEAWAAAKLDDIEGKDLFKWALILLATHGIALFHAEIGAFIAGFSGGGGGGGGGAVGTALGMIAPLGVV